MRLTKAAVLMTLLTLFVTPRTLAASEVSEAHAIVEVGASQSTVPGVWDFHPTYSVSVLRLDESGQGFGGRVTLLSTPASKHNPVIAPDHATHQLRFMEENPGLDLGAPGPLVHFVEKFHGVGYEEKLLRSLSRRPTTHTVWMLDRVLNSTRDSRARDRLLDALRAAQNHPMVDDQTKKQAARFLARLDSGAQRPH